MTGSRPLRLEFASEIPANIRSRADYVLRVFAAIYGYRIATLGEAGEARILFYGPRPAQGLLADAFYIPSLYKARGWNEAAPELCPHKRGTEYIPLAHGLDSESGRPDWLGEIFEWLSSSYESGIAERDGAGRIPFDAMVFRKQKLNPRKPHASQLMAWLASELCGTAESRAFVTPESPVTDAKHLIVCTHDIDSYYTSVPRMVVRLGKNLLIAFVTYKSWPYFVSNATLLLKVLTAQAPVDYVPPLVEALERQGARSTFFVVAKNAHRRDPVTYDMPQIREQLLLARRRGFDVDLHGSYMSVIEGTHLVPEAALLQSTLGGSAMGGRQHWLRFDTHEKLFREITAAGLRFDSTLGFAEQPGFRNGASFAFPPYDLQNERPYEFLEIPLAIMDGSLAVGCLQSGESPQAVAYEVLKESRKWGWGGVSILWHNPLDAIQVPPAINQVFWDSAAQRDAHQEKWVSGREFLRLSLPRYQAAGLLQGVKADA